MWGLPETAQIALVSGVILALREAIGYGYNLWKGNPKEIRSGNTQLIRHYDGVIEQYVAALAEAKSAAADREARLVERIIALEKAVEAKDNSHVNCLKMLSASQMEIMTLKSSRDKMEERLNNLETMLAGDHAKQTGADR